MISLQGEDQRVGSCAEDLTGGKVQAVIHLEVKATCHSTYTRTESTSRTEALFPNLFHLLV